MDERLLSTITIVCALYYGIQCIRIIPTIIRLVQALQKHETQWPGPPAFDPNPRIRYREQRIGKPMQYLFPTFIKNSIGVISSFILSTILALNIRFQWLVPLPGKEIIAFGIPLLAIIFGGQIYRRRAIFFMRITQSLLCK